MCERHKRYYEQIADEHNARIAMESDPENIDLVVDFLLKSQSIPYFYRAVLLEKTVKHYADLNKEVVNTSGYKVWLAGWWLASICSALDRCSETEFPVLKEMVEYAISLFGLAPAIRKKIVVTYLSRSCFSIGRFEDCIKLTESNQPVEKTFEYAASLVEINAYDKALTLFEELKLFPFRELILPVQESYLVRALKALGRGEEGAALQELNQQALSQWKSKSLEHMESAKHLPAEFEEKFASLFELEKAMIASRFGLPYEEGGHMDFGYPMTYKEIALRWYQDDAEFVQHIEEIALSKLGFSREYLMNLCHPGYVYNENGVKQFLRLKAFSRKPDEKETEK